MNKYLPDAEPKHYAELEGAALDSREFAAALGYTAEVVERVIADLKPAWPDFAPTEQGSYLLSAHAMHLVQICLRHISNEAYGRLLSKLETLEAQIN